MKKNFTFGLEIQEDSHDVYVGNFGGRMISSLLGLGRRIGSLLFGSVLLTAFTLIPTICHASGFTVNVSASTSAVNTNSLRSALLADLTTGYFLGTVTPSQFFVNTYSVNLFGVNPNYQAPSASTTLITLDTITNKLTSISTYTFIVGYAQGMLYERNNDASALGSYMGLCDNSTNYIVIPSTIPLPFTWSKETCNQVLGFMDNWIITQTSGIAVVPNPPIGF